MINKQQNPNQNRTAPTATTNKNQQRPGQTGGQPNQNKQSGTANNQTGRDQSKF